MGLTGAHHILVTDGRRGFFLSSNGKRPVSSWKAMTPALHTSEAGPTWELSTSGAMYLPAVQPSATAAGYCDSCILV